MKLQIKSAREAMGYSQKQLASMLGIGCSTLSQYETGKREPDLETLNRIAESLSTTINYLLGKNENIKTHVSGKKDGVWVPVLGHVAAGIPIETVEDILDYEEISQAMASQGEHFALKIKGDSMEPRIKDGDVVIVRKQDYADNGDIAVVLVNGDEATVKRIKKSPDGLMLIPSNDKYDPMLYTNDDIAKLPVTILGRVVELRAKF